jgi:hypothetical protein
MAASEGKVAETHSAQYNPDATVQTKRCGPGGALRDAATRACVGVPNDDRDMSPFDHREDIESVAQLYSPSSGGKNPTRHFLGATVVFHATPGMTAQWLQRVIDCHLARNAALGHDVPEMAYCPLVPKGVSAGEGPSPRRHGKRDTRRALDDALSGHQEKAFTPLRRRPPACRRT